jgi:hypothetical protein
MIWSSIAFRKSIVDAAARLWDPAAAANASYIASGCEFKAANDTKRHESRLNDYKKVGDQLDHLCGGRPHV